MPAAPRIDDIDVADLFRVRPRPERDTFEGLAATYRFPRLYGGHVLAQSLAAAIATVDPAYAVHSLHAYFIRPGTSDEPVTYVVDRLRDGRSFVTRSVVAQQAGRAILHASCSFQVDEDGADVEGDTMPDVPGPDDDHWSDSGWGPMDRRAEMGTAGHHHWLRLKPSLGDDPALHACGLAFLSDGGLMTAARRTHPDSTADEADRRRFANASLDHALWFHRPSRADEWHVFSVRSQGLIGGRGLVVGSIFDAAGSQVATVAQEALVRVRRPRS